MLCRILKNLQHSRQAILKSRQPIIYRTIQQFSVQQNPLNEEAYETIGQNNETNDSQKQDEISLSGNAQATQKKPYQKINMSIEESLDQIINMDTKFQLTKLRDLYLKSETNSKKEYLVNVAKNQYNQQITQILRSQAKYYIKKKNHQQLLLLYKVMSMYGDYLFRNLSDISIEFDRLVRQTLIPIASNFNYITLSSIYFNLIEKVDKTAYMETSKIINNHIMNNQKNYPDNALITHYIRFKNIFNLKESDLKLNFNESLPETAKLVIKLSHSNDKQLSSQLFDHIKDKQFDVQTLNLLFLNDLNIDNINLLERLKNIQENKLYENKNKQDIVYTFVSLTNLYKHLIHYFEKEQKLQEVKNIGLQSTTKKEIPFTTNCLEVKPIYLPLGYSAYQEECLQVLIQITKNYIKKIEDDGFQTNLTTCRVSLFYQISKLQLAVDPELVRLALKNFKQYYTSIRGLPIINAYCTLCNFYSYKEYQEEINELLSELEENSSNQFHIKLSIRPKILKTFKNDRYINDIFILAYSAQLCFDQLNQKQLSENILILLNKIVEEGKFSCLSIISTFLFLEKIGNQIPITKKIIDTLNTQFDTNTLPFSQIKQALVLTQFQYKYTNGIIIQWFLKNVNSMNITDITLCLHLFNKKNLRHIINRSDELLNDLKMKFLQCKHENNQVLIEYRRNNLLDETLLSSFEQYLLKQLNANRFSFSQIIDFYYNITRLRVADKKFVEAINAFPSSAYDNLKFSDYNKMINSSLIQQVDQVIIEELLNKLIQKINSQKINISQEYYQQRKQFYICLKQIQYIHPSLEIKDSQLINFFEEMNVQIEKERNKINNNELSDEEEDNQIELGDSPYEQQMSKGLQQLNIPFIREYVIEFFKIDFFLPNHKICIEMNGDLHYFNDNPTPPTLQKQKYLENLGYQVITIRGIEWKKLNETGIQFEQIVEWLKTITSSS